MAADALPLADEELGTALLGVRERRRGAMHPRIEAALPAGELSLVCAQRLAQIDDDARDRALVRVGERIVFGEIAGHAVAGGPSGERAIAAGVGGIEWRQPREIRQRSEHRLVL